MAMVANRHMGLITIWRPKEPTITEMVEKGAIAYRLGHEHLGGLSRWVPKPEE